MKEINNYTSFDELRKRIMDAAVPNGEVAMLQSHTIYKAMSPLNSGLYCFHINQ